jgi:hypothetical protein
VIRRGFGGAKIEDAAYYLHRIVYPPELQSHCFFAGTNNITGSANDMPADSILHWGQTHQPPGKEKISHRSHILDRHYPGQFKDKSDG